MDNVYGFGFNGALSKGDIGPMFTGNNGANAGGFPLYFDASKSNAIYGTSDIVQPPALTMKYIIKY